MQDRVGVEILAQVAVEGGEGVRRREGALEQQPHRVALVAQRRLHADQHVAEPLAEHEDRAAVALMSPGAGPHCARSLQVTLAAHVIVDRNAGGDIGGHAEALRVALQDALAQIVDVGGQLDVIAFAPARCSVLYSEA